jgi:hypothetical protein
MIFCFIVFVSFLVDGCDHGEGLDEACQRDEIDGMRTGGALAVIEVLTPRRFRMDGNYF